MAKIVENQVGRRLIRLSTEDVLTVVNVYQQQLYSSPETKSFSELKTLLAQNPLYLPEEI